ncbi:hypothetical protein Tco_0067609 [Tanacetum coccineum]
MALFDYRLNSLYAIKECSSCGTLYTGDCDCSKGSLEDKILVPIPNLSQRPLKIEKICLDCGDPVHGLYCRQCALIRKTLEEVFQDFQDTSKSSDDDTNFVNQEPFVVKQGPGINSSQSPPQINHNCCYECGDSLDDIFCQRCTCKSCGKGAHYGYNCPPQIPIISNPEPCYNQNLNEILQNLQSLQQQCLFGTEMRILSLLILNLQRCCLRISPNKDKKKRMEKEKASLLMILKIPICYDDDRGLYHAITPSYHQGAVNLSKYGDLLIANIEALKDNPAPSSDVMIKSSSTFLNLFLEETNTFDNSLIESFCFDLEEISSGSCTISHSDDYNSLYLSLSF